MSAPRNAAKTANRRRAASTGAIAIPELLLAATFDVGTHTLRIFRTARSWVAAIDESRLPGSYLTQAEAWEAGVREADLLDRRKR